MAGNKCYRSPEDLPSEIPVLPLSGALLLPNGQMPLNIFEPRYVEMVDAAMAGDRLIGMIQPRLGQPDEASEAALCDIGCAGRIVQFAETGDGRYLITLVGVCRFEVAEEVASGALYRRCRVSASPFADDFEPKKGEDEVDRARLLKTFRAYLDAHGLEADWESVNRASNAGLVTALSMMSPWGAAEKQALLEAPDHKTRAEALVA